MKETQNLPKTNVEQPVVPNANTQPNLEVSGQCVDTNVGGTNTEPINQREQEGRGGVVGKDQDMSSNNEVDGPFDKDIYRVVSVYPPSRIP